MNLTDLSCTYLAHHKLGSIFTIIPSTVKAPYNDALYTDNRVTTTNHLKTVGLHCKFPPYNSNDARYNDQPNWPNVAV